MRISDWSSDVCSSDLRLGDVGAAEQVDLHHQVEILHRHLGKAFVAQDTGVVDQDVDAAPFRLRLGDHLDHLVIFGDAAAVRHGGAARGADFLDDRSEEHTSELQSLMRSSYAVFCLKKKNKHQNTERRQHNHTTDHNQ